MRFFLSMQLTSMRSNVILDSTDLNCMDKKAEEKQAHKFGVNDDNFHFLGDLFKTKIKNSELQIPIQHVHSHTKAEV